MKTAEILAAYAADMPRDRQWTLDETRTVMKRMAASQAEAWAENTWGRLLAAREYAAEAVSAGEATKDEANAALEQLNTGLLAQLDKLLCKIGDDIGINDPAEFKVFAGSVAEPFNRRCLELIAGTPMGITGRA